MNITYDKYIRKTQVTKLQTSSTTEWLSIQWFHFRLAIQIESTEFYYLIYQRSTICVTDMVSDNFKQTKEQMH